jgi:hypothetical protein
MAGARVARKPSRRDRSVGLSGLAFVVALVAAGSLLAGGARSASAAPRVIAFARPDGVYVVHADGSGLRALRRGGVVSQGPGAEGLAGLDPVSLTP